MITTVKPIVAAFDFDGTLTCSDSLIAYLRYFYETHTLLQKSFPLMLTWLGYKLKIIPNASAKQKVVASFFTGKALATLQQQGQLFATTVIPTLLRAKAMQCLAWHQRQGHCCILVSAALDIYLAPWGKQAGFTHVLCSGLEVAADGLATGRLLGTNCFGQQKVERLQALLGAKEQYILYAYGDTRGDKELLAYADYGFYRQFPSTPIT